MTNDSKLKILLVGPVSTGKSAIANFLSNSTENFPGECRPTRGVRILEFGVQGLRGKGVYQNSVEVELWDCSGNNKYQSCWPALKHKTDGVIFVYTDASNQQKTDLDRLYSFFVEEPNFPETCCLIIKNEFGDIPQGKVSGNPLPSLNHTSANIEEKGGEFKKSFNAYISAVLKANLND